MPTFDLRDSMSSTISSDQQISLRQNVTSPLWRQTLFGSRENVSLFIWNLLGKENAERKENEHKRPWWLTTNDVYNSDSIKAVNKYVSLRPLQMWGSQDRSLPFSIPTFVLLRYFTHSTQVTKRWNLNVLGSSARVLAPSSSTRRSQRLLGAEDSLCSPGWH